MPDTVPIFAPDGTLGDIPADQLAAAVRAGAKPGVNIIAPDGSRGVVPADRSLEAASVPGARIAPFEDQAIEHPGFWAGLRDDLRGMVSGIATLPQLFNSDPRAIAARTSQLSEQVRTAGEQDEARKAANYPGWYRGLALPASQFGVNVPGMEQAAATGDVGGVAGHAAALPVVMAVSEGVARGAPPAARASAPLVRAVAKGTNLALARAPGTLGAAIGGGIGAATHVPYGAEIGAGAGAVVGKELLPQLRVPGEQFGLPRPTYPGAPLPEVPPPELLQAGALQQGGAALPPEPSAALGNVSVRETMPTPTPAEAQPTVPRAMVRGPQPISGESALTQLLTSQDNATLLKIAKSRGINVTKESQLKPGIADSMLARKIIDDFSPDELQELGAKYMEATRFQHQFGNITPEAWHRMTLQYYFPDVKIPAAMMKRSQASIQQAGSDLTDILQKSLVQAKGRK